MLSVPGALIYNICKLDCWAESTGEQHFKQEFAALRGSAVPGMATAPPDRMESPFPSCTSPGHSPQEREPSFPPEDPVAGRIHLCFWMQRQKMLDGFPEIISIENSWGQGLRKREFLGWLPSAGPFKRREGKG